MVESCRYFAAGDAEVEDAWRCVDDVAGTSVDTVCRLSGGSVGNVGRRAAGQPRDARTPNAGQ